MRLSWNEAKCRANLRKHGLDFADAKSVFGGITVTMEDRRYDYREQRLVTLGLLLDTVVVIAHLEDSEGTGIISMRKATRREQTLFFQSI